MDICNAVSECGIMPAKEFPEIVIMKTKARPESTAKLLLQQEQAQALAESCLRTSDLRITHARTRVLATLLLASRALSHQELQEALTDMDRVTLYRALDSLTEAGLSHKIAGEDRAYRYNASIARDESPRRSAFASPGQHQHSHFKCTRCAKVFCLDVGNDAKLLEGSMLAPGLDASVWRKQVQGMLQQALGKGFQSHEIELTIKGFCAECASASV
jgi:Fur family transcriptional regulator, ferric uptake regulator